MQILFGGTFDPVHSGHVAMIEALSAAFPEATVHVIPNRLPPHRQSVASSTDRLKMLEMVLARFPSVVVNRIELDRDGPSYTRDTLLLFRDQFGAQESLVLALGADAAAGLSRWHHPEEIATLAHVCVLDREGHSAILPPVMDALKEIDRADMLQNVPFGHLLRLKTPVIRVSSTAVREKLMRGETDLPVPDEISEYIHTQRLYRTPND